MVRCAPPAAYNAHRSWIVAGWRAGGDAVAGGAFAGPVGIWAVGALAGGLAFLLAGVIGPVPHRA